MSKLNEFNGTIVGNFDNKSEANLTMDEAGIKPTVANAKSVYDAIKLTVVPMKKFVKDANGNSVPQDVAMHYSTAIQCGMLIKIEGEIKLVAFGRSLLSNIARLDKKTGKVTASVGLKMAAALSEQLVPSKDDDATTYTGDTVRGHFKRMSSYKLEVAMYAIRGKAHENGAYNKLLATTATGGGESILYNPAAGSQNNVIDDSLLEAEGCSLVIKYTMRSGVHNGVIAETMIKSGDKYNNESLEFYVREFRSYVDNGKMEPSILYTDAVMKMLARLDPIKTK